MANIYSVYIMANYTRSVFYTGMTNKLEIRVGQHKRGEGGYFTKKYKCFYLMYYEEYSLVVDAISHEKMLKNYKREWKINLIKKDNPDMNDLAADWYD